MADSPIITAFLEKAQPTQQLVLSQHNEPLIKDGRVIAYSCTVYYVYDSGSLSRGLIGSMHVEGQMWHIDYLLDEMCFRIHPEPS